MRGATVLSAGSTVRVGPPGAACHRWTGRLGFGAMPDDEAKPSSAGGSALPERAMSARRVAEGLDEAESMGLLATGEVGRLVYASRYGPVALPVEYVVREGSVVVRVWAAATEE